MIKNAVNEIRDLIRGAPNLSEWLPELAIQGANKRAVFSNNLPPELQNAVDITTIRLEEIMALPQGFAGDHAQVLQQDIQLQIWYAPNTDVEAFEWTLNELLENIGFYVVSASGHTADEETQQIETTFQYRRFKQKRGN